MQTAGAPARIPRSQGRDCGAGNNMVFESRFFWRFITSTQKDKFKQALTRHGCGPREVHSRVYFEFERLNQLGGFHVEEACAGCGGCTLMSRIAEVPVGSEGGELRTSCSSL